MLRRFPTISSCIAVPSVRNASKAVARRPLASWSQMPPRPISALPEKTMGLYNPGQEKDSCGVGLVAQLKRKHSRDIVVDANEMLVGRSFVFFLRILY